MVGIPENLRLEFAPGVNPPIGIEKRLIAVKLCECGCGAPVKICNRDDPRKGYIKGEPRRFLSYHQWRGRRWTDNIRIDTDGYVLLYKPDHPQQNRRYIQEHRIVVENILQKYLQVGSVVHHMNEIKSDNTPRNLVVCQDKGYHSLLHRRMRAFKACGHGSWRKCNHCHEHDDPKNMYTSDTRAQHRDCHTKYENARRHGHQQEVR